MVSLSSNDFQLLLSIKNNGGSVITTGLRNRSAYERLAVQGLVDALSDNLSIVKYTITVKGEVAALRPPPAPKVS